MDTPAHEPVTIPHKDLVYKVIGCAFEVLRELGPGLHAEPYENALVVEFQRQDFNVAQRSRFPVLYKGVAVGDFVPDLIVEDAVVVAAHVIEQISNVEREEMMSCLRITEHRIGIVLNFKRAKLEWERVVPSFPPL